MECKKAESDQPLIQAERTEDGEEPPPLLHIINSAWPKWLGQPLRRFQGAIEIGNLLADRGDLEPGHSANLRKDESPSCFSHVQVILSTVSG